MFEVPLINFSIHTYININQEKYMNRFRGRGESCSLIVLMISSKNNKIYFHIKPYSNKIWLHMVTAIFREKQLWADS